MIETAVVAVIVGFACCGLVLLLRRNAKGGGCPYASRNNRGCNLCGRNREEKERRQ